MALLPQSFNMFHIRGSQTLSPCNPCVSVQLQPCDELPTCEVKENKDHQILDTLDAEVGLQ